MKRTITKKSLGFWLVAAVVLLLDRITKELAAAIPAEGIPLIPGILGLRYAENTGIAFSLLSGLPRLTGILGLAIVIGGFVWLRNKEFAVLPLTGLALMAGGAAGNMLDRLIRGYVPDMIETLFVNFPVFNIADSCLTVGCVLANLITGCAAWDVVFGSMATLLGAIGTRLLKDRPAIAWIPPVVSNMVIVPIVLMKVYGVDNVDVFGSVFNGDSLWIMLVVTVGIGEIIACGVLGMLLYHALKKNPRILEVLD